MDSDTNAPTLTSLQNVKEFGKLLSCKAIEISMELKKFLSEFAQRKEDDQVFNELLFAALAFRNKRKSSRVLNRSIDDVLLDTTGKLPIKPASGTEQYFASSAANHQLCKSESPAEEEYKKRRDAWSSSHYKEAFSVFMDPHFTFRGVLHIFSILKFLYELGEIYPLIHMLGYPKTFVCFSIMKEFNTIPLWCAYAVGDIMEDEDFKLLTERVAHAAEQLLSNIKVAIQEQDERPPTVCDIELFSRRLHGLVAIEQMGLALKSLQSDCNEITKLNAILAQCRIIQVLGEYPNVLRIPNFHSSNTELMNLFGSLQKARLGLSHLGSRQIQQLCSSTHGMDIAEISMLLSHVEVTWNLWKELDWMTYKNEIETCITVSPGNRNNINLNATRMEVPGISSLLSSITSRLEHIRKLIGDSCSPNQRDTKWEDELRIQFSFLREHIPDSRQTQMMSRTSIVNNLALQYTVGSIGESLKTCVYQAGSREPLRSHLKFMAFVRNSLFHAIYFEQPLPSYLFEPWFRMACFSRMMTCHNVDAQHCRRNISTQVHECIEVCFCTKRMLSGSHS